MPEKKKVKSAKERRITILLILQAAARAGVLIKKEFFDTFFWLLKYEYSLVTSTYPFDLSNLCYSKELRKDLEELIRFDYVSVVAGRMIDKQFFKWAESKKGEFVNAEAFLDIILTKYISISPDGEKRLRAWARWKACGSDNFDLTVNEWAEAVAKISGLTDKQLYNRVQRFAHAPKKISPTKSDAPALAKT